MHKAQLSGEEHCRSAPRPARGLSHCQERQAGTRRGRYPEGRAVHSRDLFEAARIPAQGISAEAQGRSGKIKSAIELMQHARRRPVLYGRRRDQFRTRSQSPARELVKLTGFPITSTLMGSAPIRLPIRSGSGCSACTAHMKPIMAMQDCDLMICVGARFDDRITGRLEAFPRVSEDPHRYRSILDQQERQGRRSDRRGLCARAGGYAARCGARSAKHADKKALDAWWQQIDKWRARKSLAYNQLGRRHQAAIGDRATL